MFVEEYLQELRAQRYRPAAVARYVARCWQRGRNTAAGNPTAARSVLILGVALFGLAFLGSVALAFTAGLEPARRTLTWTGITLIPITGLLLLHLDLLRNRDGYLLSAINLPTAITVARLAALPALAVTLAGGHWRSAFWLFLALGVSDIVDGWLARRQHQETRLGAVLDPISDICFHGTLFVSMFVAGLVGPWILALALIRYSGLLLGGAYIYIVHGPVRIQSTLPGKLTGLAGGTMIGFLLLGPAYGSGAWGPVLVPLARDGILVLLAGSIVHAGFMGWYNLRHAHAQAQPVIRDVRFGEGGRGA